MSSSTYLPNFPRLVLPLITPSPVLAVFTEGVNLYINGEWPNAKKMLEKANSMMAKLAPSLGGDGPCLTLLEYINEHECKPPADWRGYRPLTSK